ncbi:unnamed protein product [Pieris macdunnoughi]|uniref:Uncharacterized protein n=1 Tax=Pieris macdunnoughi TaxID=345717 RepID=A0A821NJQ1_9NEOP|nr:unnamed protein product [Pieris macdunnoughi]
MTQWSTASFQKPLDMMFHDEVYGIWLWTHFHLKLIVIVLKSWLTMPACSLAQKSPGTLRRLHGAFAPGQRGTSLPRGFQHVRKPQPSSFQDYVGDLFLCAETAKQGTIRRA